MSTDTALGELLSWVAGRKRRRWPVPAGRGACSVSPHGDNSELAYRFPDNPFGKMSRQVPGKGPTFRPSIL